MLLKLVHSRNVFLFANGSVCCGCKETFGDCGEGKETWCCSYEWQCAVGQGRVDGEEKTGLLDVALVGMKEQFTVVHKNKEFFTSKMLKYITGHPMSHHLPIPSLQKVLHL